MDNLVFSNMMHRPARTFVSIIGIAVGILLIVFTYGMANGGLRKQAERDSNVGAELFVRAPGSAGQGGSEAFQLPVSMIKEIEKIEGVKFAIPYGQNSANSKSGIMGKMLVDGVNFDEYSKMSGIKIIEGSPFTNSKSEIIIDSAYKQEKKLNLGDSISIWERDFKIVGIYEPAGGARLKMPLDVMQKQNIGDDATPEELNKVSTILVKVKEGFSEDQVGENIQKVFPKNLILRTKDFEEIYLNSIPALNVFLSVVIGVAATISALVILLTMYTTVTERTRQIGILKSLGMSNGKIAWTIAQEALLLSGCGIILGVILTYLLHFILSRFMTLNFDPSPELLITTTIVGLLGGALGAIYPALRAARLDAVESLSYE